METATPRKVVKEYQALLDGAILWLNTEGHAVYPKRVTVKPSFPPNGVVIVQTQVLHFQSWPERPGSSEKLDILASVREEISQQPKCCTRSTARVTYCRVRDGVANVVESIHYDAEVPPKPHHPVCHAQASSRPLDLPVSLCHARVDVGHIKSRCKSVRIPTAHVNLPGLLVALTADHLPSEKWRQFMKHCQPYFDKIPPLASCGVTQQIHPKAKLMARYWYELGE